MVHTWPQRMGRAWLSSCTLACCNACRSCSRFSACLPACPHLPLLFHTVHHQANTPDMLPSACSQKKSRKRACWGQALCNEQQHMSHVPLCAACMQPPRPCIEAPQQQSWCSHARSAASRSASSCTAARRSTSLAAWCPRRFSSICACQTGHIRTCGDRRKNMQTVPWVDACLYVHRIDTLELAANRHSMRNRGRDGRTSTFVGSLSATWSDAAGA